MQNHGKCQLRVFWLDRQDALVLFASHHRGRMAQRIILNEVAQPILREAKCGFEELPVIQRVIQLLIQR